MPIEESSMNEHRSDLKIIRLANTFEAFGLVLDYLSRTPPFADFELGSFAGVIRAQLSYENHLAAMSGKLMVGYAGWLHTNAEYAEAWLRGDGILKSLDGRPHDCAALTVFVVSDARATPRLIRGARELNKGVRVYFKRDYDGSTRGPRKASVLNFS